MFSKNIAIIIGICTIIFLSANTGAVAAPGRSTGKSPTKSGTYSFSAATGKEYIGKSIDVQRRLNQHKQSGKLLEKDAGSIKIEYINTQGKVLSTIESTRIKAGDTVTNGSLENKQHAPLSRNMQKIFETHHPN